MCFVAYVHACMLAYLSVVLMCLVRLLGSFACVLLFVVVCC